MPSYLWLPLILAMFGVQPQAVRVSQFTIRDEIVMKVPVIRQRVAWPVGWVEKKGPKCIRSEWVVAAALAGENSIDFLLRDRRRVRAKMDSACPTLDFYGDLYLNPDDGQICARREEIRNRMGGTCRIERFRLMVPKPVN